MVRSERETFKHVALGQEKTVFLDYWKCQKSAWQATKKDFDFNSILNDNFLE